MPDFQTHGDLKCKILGLGVPLPGSSTPETFKKNVENMKIKELRQIERKFTYYWKKYERIKDVYNIWQQENTYYSWYKKS